MKLYLVDDNADLVSEWERVFSEFPEVEIVCDNMLNVAECAIVSPANSFGYMDGGIDLAYSNYFGWDLEKKVKKAIDQLPEAILPVGSSIIVKTGHIRIPYIIVAPTMRMPEEVKAANAYFAMSAILRTASKNLDKINKLFCPGLGTGVGKIPFDEAANEMANAYKKLKQQLKF